MYITMKKSSAHTWKNKNMEIQWKYKTEISRII